MRAAAKLLRMVALENGGPRKRTVLDAAAKRYGEGPYLVDYLIAAGRLVRYGRARGATWGLPRRKRAQPFPSRRP
jgi:hypothetical protein